MKEIRIGENLFEVKKHINLAVKAWDIAEAYERPSQEKIGIFNYWKRFFKELDCYVFINSCNRFMFTIGATRLVTFNGKKRVQKFLITPKHNYIANEEI